MKKTIMILGLGDAQFHLIKAAKQEEYRVVACDMREERGRSDMIDAYHHVDYMNRDLILRVANEEQVDGVISNSEPAMLNVAWLSQKMGLPGNTEESVKKFLSKEKFRRLQKEAGVFSPAHFMISSEQELLNKAEKMKFPVIIKPTESSGTRGTSRLDYYDEVMLSDAYDRSLSLSRNGQVSMEEYVEMPGLRVNDADIFVIGDEIIWDGWLWQDRARETPMLPRTEIFPMALEEDKKSLIRDTVTKIIKTSGVQLGEYNVETYFTNTGEVFVIEINPRQAGNYIPQLIEEHTGVSLTRLLVTTAVADLRYYESLKTFQRKNVPVVLQVVFSHKDGIYRGLSIAPEISPYVQWVDEVLQCGEYIKEGMNAGNAAAYVDLRFDSIEMLEKYTRDIETYIHAIVEDK